MNELHNANLGQLLAALNRMNIRLKDMFGRKCVYCDEQPTGWFSDGVFSLRDTGLDFIPKELVRIPKKSGCREIVIPGEYYRAEWFRKAVLATAENRKREKK